MRAETWTWVAIALGSAAGGVARHALTEAVTRAAGIAFPWGTLIVNLSGSAAIGGLAALAAAGWPAAWSVTTRHAAMTGVLGGFTTFSAFSVQTVALLQQGLWGPALAYVLASVGAGVAACWLSFTAVQALAR